MPVVGVEPTRVISTRNFEFLSSSSIWCHPVISSDIWFPLHKGKIHASTNNNLEYPRFFDAFSLYSVFSIWIAQMEIGGMFRRDAGPVIQDCAHRLFSFFGKYFKPVQFRGRLICIQNEATKPGVHPGSDHTIRRGDNTMKKTVSVCMTAVMALSLLAGGAVQAYALSAETVEPVSAVAEENCISSSWKRASDPALTEKVRKVFDKAFDGLEGVSYTPVALLASHTTGFGTQYRVLCKATVVVPGAQEEYVVVTLQRGWLGKAEILDIGDPLCLTNLDYEEGAVGTWQEAESPAMTEEATAAFNKATEGLVGVDYVPVTLLSTQTVAGTNYRILCEATTVYPGAEMHYAVVNVYESLEGNANIISVTDEYVS